MPSDEDRCLEAGADAYLSKPVELVHRRIDPRFRVGVKREVALPRVVRGVG
jgi:CheY-like chemotaxis protein